MQKPLPIPEKVIKDIAESIPTPFHLYDEAGIVANVRRLQRAFAWNTGFKEYFAVKATPNPFLMKLLHREGLGMDCSALAELELSDLCGIRGEEIMFTSNNTPHYEYSRAKELGAIINLDDITHLEYVQKKVGLPELLSFRLNPGPCAKGSSIIGAPEEAKFGLTAQQLVDGYRKAQGLGVTRFGLHTMPISNELTVSTFVETVKMLLELVSAVRRELGISIEFINMGGGIGIPYLPTQSAFPIETLAEEVRALFSSFNYTSLKLFMECGRYITGPYGILVTRSIHKKEIYRNYIGVDACMADLMRPGMYGSYHHISVVGKSDAPCAGHFDVVGSLCENNDKFAIQRELPSIEEGDLLIIHDTGAHGHSMGFNYNGKVRAAELLLREDGSVIEIRRRETLQDIFATLPIDKLEGFI